MAKRKKSPKTEGTQDTERVAPRKELAIVEHRFGTRLFIQNQKLQNALLEQEGKSLVRSLRQALRCSNITRCIEPFSALISEADRYFACQTQDDADNIRAELDAWFYIESHLIRELDQTFKKSLDSSGIKNPAATAVNDSNATVKYIGKDAVVVLSNQNRVVTTWAINSSGYRQHLRSLLGTQ